MDLSFDKLKAFAELFALVAGVLGLFVFLAVTSVVWFPLLLLNSPILLGLYFVAKYTKFGEPLKNAYFKAYDWIFYQSEAPRKFMWSVIYNVMCMLHPETKWKSMNYGYAAVTGEGKLVKLKSEFEEERYSIQLYHYIATKFQSVKDLKGLNVLEVGSGRGGGLKYIQTNLQPESCTGVEFSEFQVDFCQKVYKEVANLKYVVGDAEKLDQVAGLEKNSVDLVINVESSHCYGNFAEFAKQVFGVLKPKGEFVITDFRTPEEQKILEQQIKDSGLEIEKYEDITLNVVQSLKYDEKRKTDLIENNVNPILRPFFRKFSGVRGSRIYEDFEKRQCIYFAYICRKP